MPIPFPIRRERRVLDQALLSVLSKLDRQLRGRFGSHYRGLILFGSRARGDHAPDSDADVAVIMRDSIEDRWALKRRLIEETYPLLLETGLYLQCHPVTETDLDRPARGPAAPLINNIQRDGIRL